MLKANFKKYLSTIDTLPLSIEKECKTLMDSVQKINVEADIDIFVRQNQTGKEIPEPFDYEPYVEVKEIPPIVIFAGKCAS